MKTIWGGCWSKKTDLKGWHGAFEKLARKGVKLLYAAYDQSGYEGSAIAIWIEDGQIWEANDGHCSCNGLDSFSPEKTSAGALLMRKVVSHVPELEKFLKRRAKKENALDLVNLFRKPPVS